MQSYFEVFLSTHPSFLHVSMKEEAISLRNVASPPPSCEIVIDVANGTEFFKGIV